MPLITQSQTRKERRREERKKRKKHVGHVPTPAEENHEEEVVPTAKKAKREKGTKTQKASPKTNDPYSHMNPDAASAIRRDDEEIADLEAKLGLGSKNKKGREKLNKEYAKLEGYGDDFGDFLNDLDDMVGRISSQGKKGSRSREEDDEPDSEDGDDNYANNMDSEMADALRRDEDEIAELEKKLGIAKRKEKDKLYKEYAKLEGYGDDFGEFLDDLDDMVVRVTKPGRGSKDYEGLPLPEDSEEEMGPSSDDGEDEHSDDEEEVPMKEPYEAMDDDDSVLEELMREEENDDGKRDDGSASLEEQEENDVDMNDDVPDDEDSNEHEDNDSGTPESDPESAEDGSDGELSDVDATDTYRPSKGEDIYGNKLQSDEDPSSKPAKYQPPHLRKKGNNEDDQQGTMLVIRRSLNNALNRLSEDTLISVAQQVAALYSAHPTQLVHEMLWKNMNDACVSPPMLMAGLIPVYLACLVGVHVQTGDTVQVGEYMLEAVVADLWKELRAVRETQEAGKKGDSTVDLDGKRVCNRMLLLCYLYNYNIVHCSFMYDIIRHLIENFSEIDVECLLLLLSHCGRSLRSDDPLALKEIVLLVQKQNSMKSKLASSSRAEYMVSAITDLKNNKRRKQDGVFMEKTTKLKKQIGRVKSVAAKSNVAKTVSEASLRITLKDILEADTNGRWWKVGASWVGNQYRYTGDGEKEDKSAPKVSSTEGEQDEKLLALASKYRMNTDRKRSIFCIIMGGEDCEDAFEKLCRGSMLQNKSERDTVRVLLECCGNEKSYNKFYGHLAARMCEYQPQCKFSLQLAYWDFFKQFDSMDDRKAANLAKLLFHLIVSHHVLKLMSVLKAMDITAGEEMEETGMIFLTILLTNVLEHFENPSEAIALFSSQLSEKSDDSKREQEVAVKASLLVFLMETLKSSPKYKKGSRFRKNLKAVTKELENDGFETAF